MRVLFVCTGNVCRSPMAEGFLKRESLARGLGLDVRSTGTHAWAGRAATIDGRRVMEELGVPIPDHRTLELDRALLDWADLVIALAAEHARDVLRIDASAEHKTYTLKEFVRLLPALPGYDYREEWLRAAHALRSSNGAGEDMDVDDPFGERTTAYRRVAEEIRDLVAQMAEGLQDAGVGNGGSQ